MFGREARDQRLGAMSSSRLMPLAWLLGDFTINRHESRGLENLQQEILQVPRFRHGGKDGMVPGLSTLFK
jgi:hypothetical protein